MEEILIADQNAKKDEATSSAQPTASSTSSWWGFTSSLLDKTIDKVKQQSEHIINIYKEDLKEFSQTIQTDTKEAIKKLPQEQEKLTALLGIVKGENSKGVIVDRQKARLIQLQSELTTYCTDPADLEAYQAFTKDFQIGARTEEISTLLNSNEKVREIHTKLVPATVSYKDFWERYFFKFNQLQQLEARRAALVKKASTSAPDEEEVGWDVEDETDVTQSGTPPESNKKEVEQYLEKLEDKTETITTTTTTTSPKKEEAPAKTEKPEVVPPTEQKPAPTKERPKKSTSSEDVEDGWESWE